MDKAPMPWLAERAARMSPRWSPWPIRLIVLAVLAVETVTLAVPTSRDGGWLALFPVSMLLGAWVLAEYTQRVRRQLRVGLLPGQTSEAIAVAGVAVLALSGAILSATMASDLWTRMQAGRSENTVPELVWAPVVGRPLEMRVVHSVLESRDDGMQLRVDWQLRNTGEQGVVVATEGLQVRQNHGLSKAPQERTSLTLQGHASSDVLRSTYTLSSDTQADALYWGAFDHPDVYVVHLMPAFPAPTRPANDSAAWDPEAVRSEQAPWWNSSVGSRARWAGGAGGARAQARRIQRSTYAWALPFHTSRDTAGARTRVMKDRTVDAVNGIAIGSAALC